MPDNNHFEEPKKQSLFEKEEEVLKFWKENKIFEKSLKKNPPSKTFSFYDGPPFITGLPHYATLLPSIAKDIIPRYQTMKGNYVPRVWGWDVHGLPIENKVEEQLGFKNKKDIEEFGIDKFIAEARKYVSESSDQWRWYIDHIGRWADMDNPYRTDDLSYVETVMWIFKQLYEKDLIYKGQRVLLYCTRCATVLSKFEVTMDPENYKDVDDPAVTVAFRLKDEPDTYVLAWTTTPWTLPANNGLAVGANIKYVKLTDGKKSYIIAKDALTRYPEFEHWKTVGTLTGDDLEGKSFEPLFTPNITPDPKKDYKIYTADFATTEEGTGIVHIAPAFGEDDFDLGREKGLTTPSILDEDGRFLTDSPWPWAGKFYKDADSQITETLKEKGLLVGSDRITHSYPHCYRCKTPLIYMAQNTWLLKIDEIRKDLVKTNKKINWVPEHFGEKRFKHNIESAPDWSISRTRYWGIPIPIWETEDGERIVVGSIKEIEELSGEKVTDLHRPVIDDIVLTTKSGKKAHRVKEVLDVWFESGSMPYAQDHYPFENKEKFERGFPADFITEYTGQLRGWFYSLHVIATALMKKPSFKNVVVTGVLAGTDGKKMSKSAGNFPDPRITIERYGAEALRLYFMSNRIMRGEDTSFSEDELKESYGVLNILHNSYKYFVTYANLHGWKPHAAKAPRGKPDESKKGSDYILDRWIVARLEEFIGKYASSLDAFDFVTSTRAIRPFVEDLSTWYIRRSRDRFAAGEINALATLHNVLSRFATAVAPTLPFTSEIIYKNLVPEGKESVHLEDYPKADAKLVKKQHKLLEDMTLVREVASVAHSLRSEAGHPLRQKLAAILINNMKKLDSDLIELIRAEANVEKVVFDETAGSFACAKLGDAEICLDTNLTEELVDEGVDRNVIRAVQEKRKNENLKVGVPSIMAVAPNSPEIEKLISDKIRVHKIESATNTTIVRVEETEDMTEILGGKAKIKKIEPPQNKRVL